MGSALFYLWVGDFQIKWLQVYMEADDKGMFGVERGGSWLQFVGGDSEGRGTAYWFKERERALMPQQCIYTELAYCHCPGERIT